jgi:hypothetical protein
MVADLSGQLSQVAAMAEFGQNAASRRGGVREGQAVLQA